MSDIFDDSSVAALNRFQAAKTILTDMLPVLNHNLAATEHEYGDDSKVYLGCKHRYNALNAFLAADPAKPSLQTYKSLAPVFIDLKTGSQYLDETRQESLADQTRQLLAIFQESGLTKFAAQGYPIEPVTVVQIPSRKTQDFSAV